MKDDDDHLLQQTFGLPALRPHQRRALVALRARRDVLVILSTGGGKSLCYQFPAVAGLAPVLVVSPLVALMKDQVDALTRRGIAAAQMSAALSDAARRATWEAYAARRLTLLYLSPEALDGAETRAHLARTPPAFLAVDEAHCISEWGESFRPSYLRLGAVRSALGDPPTIALTATATGRTQRDIVEQLHLRDVEHITSGFDRPNLSFEVEHVADERRRAERLEQLARTAGGSAVFYAPTRRRTEALAAQLRRAGVAARSYHAGLPPDERTEVQDAFLTGRIPAIVATCAFDMGVDKGDVRLVVHAAPPASLEAYYQEAGRAGRDGAPGRCLALLAPGDLAATRARLDVAIPGLLVLHRLYALVRDAARHRRPVAHHPALLAELLAVPPRLAMQTADLLLRGGYLSHAHGEGDVAHVLATERRLSTDRTLDPGDVAFVRRVRRLLALGTHEGAPPRVARRDLRRLEVDLSLDDRLRRVEEARLLVWRRPTPALRCIAPWNEEDVLRLQHIGERRVRRALWRFDGVVRFFTTVRCRRWVLLRYFGDDSPLFRCGRCDSCRSSPAAGVTGGALAGASPALVHRPPAVRLP